MLLADITDDEKSSWLSLADSIDNFAIKCCSSWQAKYLGLKTEDPQTQSYLKILKYLYIIKSN